MLIHVWSAWTLRPKELYSTPLIPFRALQTLTWFIARIKQNHQRYIVTVNSQDKRHRSVVLCNPRSFRVRFDLMPNKIQEYNKYERGSCQKNKYERGSWQKNKIRKRIIHSFALVNKGRSIMNAVTILVRHTEILYFNIGTMMLHIE
jgi:hypothetical protein